MEMERVTVQQRDWLMECESVCWTEWRTALWRENEMEFVRESASVIEWWDDERVRMKEGDSVRVTG